MTGDPVVLDATALLALLYKEPVADALVPMLPTARTSSVTWAEVVRQVLHRGGAARHAHTLEHLGLEVDGFDRAAAEHVAELATGEVAHWPMHDLAALALSRYHRVPVVSCNPAFADPQLEHEDVTHVVLTPSP